MIMLRTLTLVGSALGAASGIFSIGIDGLILGCAIGFATGVAIWSLVSMGTQWQHERRMDRYFNNNNQKETD